MAINMYVNMGDIKGESKVKKDMIDLLSWTWGMTQTGTGHTGSGNTAAKVSVRDVSFTKYVDMSTPNLIKYCCSGKALDKVTLAASKSTDWEYLVLEMQHVIVSSVTNGGAGQDEQLVETVTLNFKAFTIKYTTQNDKGGKGPEVPASWDIASNRAG
jgi:type VI secretion system secreted protein Hcp